MSDRRTDGQNYDSQDGASIAASRGKMFTSSATGILLFNFSETFFSSDVLIRIYVIIKAVCTYNIFLEAQFLSYTRLHDTTVVKPVVKPV